MGSLWSSIKNSFDVREDAVGFVEEIIGPSKEPYVSITITKQEKFVGSYAITVTATSSDAIAIQSCSHRLPDILVRALDGLCLQSLSVSAGEESRNDCKNLTS
jgi:hypothetical protein